MAGMTLDELRNQLSGLAAYTPESEESIRQKLAGLTDALNSAKNSYTPESEDAIRQRLLSMFDEHSSINNPYTPESNESILQRINDLSGQLSSLRNAYRPESVSSVRQRVTSMYDPQYQQDLRSLRDSVQLGLSQQARRAVTSGMQRSSYNQASLAGIRGQGLRAEEQLGAQRETNIATLMNQIIENDKNRQLQADQFRDSLQMQMNQLQTQLIEAEKDRGLNAKQNRDAQQMQLASMLSSAVDAERNRKQNADQYAYNAQLEYDKFLNSLLENEKSRRLSADQYRDSLLMQLYELANKGSGGSTNKDDKKNAQDTIEQDRQLIDLGFSLDAVLGKGPQDFYSTLVSGQQMAGNLRANPDKMKAIQDNKKALDEDIRKQMLTDALASAASSRLR